MSNERKAGAGLAAANGYAFLEVWWYIGSRRDVCYMVGPYRTDLATKLADWINSERKCHTRRKDAKVVTRTNRQRFSAAHYGLACKPQWVKRLLRRENARIDAAKHNESSSATGADRK